ncbi:unnamed protein product [Kuraishia capsulata CBS 1993]|uniref:Uncharacterized protein n=1 Tax=Kuraishia capsulata CBS 1993 TaxID=1382522 RepID=W6MTG6_9ASCO|nr:uncharacterized protein KUCA_T00001012001 [Kuraishia capsulata CBS 1993]CDK25045.1 unnamed protein product [Kuraishia capsulata CBS 1993]
MFGTSSVDLMDFPGISGSLGFRRCKSHTFTLPFPEPPYTNLPSGDSEVWPDVKNLEFKGSEPVREPWKSPLRASNTRWSSVVLTISLFPSLENSNFVMSLFV